MTTDRLWLYKNKDETSSVSWRTGRNPELKINNGIGDEVALYFSMYSEDTKAASLRAVHRLIRTLLEFEDELVEEVLAEELEELDEQD